MTSHALANIYFPIKDGTPAFSSRFDTVRTYTFHAPLWQQGFLSRDKGIDCAEKEFLAVNHYTEFIQKDIVDAKEDRHLYELVTERTVETQASPHPSTYIISIHNIVLPCKSQFKTIFSA